ncbi:MAG TPA: phosphatase PAP2 family protein [Burkholderiales bacterium]|nr:phosphatase PAP2 family protein [Burkholderiales bacterium]
MDLNGRHRHAGIGWLTQGPEDKATTALGPKTWKDELKRRTGHLWVLKMLVTMGGIAGFFYAYFWVMRHPLSAVTVMPVTWIDQLISFSPQAFSVYVSLWVYVSLGPALARDIRELAAWAGVSLAMAVAGLGTFMVLPTKIPNPAIDWSRYPSLEFLRTVDVSGNACPSLHVAFAAFTAVVLHRHLTAMRAPRALLSCNGLWCLGIVYSTMATRQHVALDVVAGLLLAGAAAIAYRPGRSGEGARSK